MILPSEMFIVLNNAAGQSPAPPKPVRTPESVKKETMDTTKSERPVNHSTPPPVAYNPSVSEQPMTSSQQSKNSSMANGALRRMSSTSDDFVLVFSGDISGISRTGSTGNEVRDRCRDLVAKALKKGFENGRCALFVCVRWCLNFLCEVVYLCLIH